MNESLQYDGLTMSMCHDPRIVMDWILSIWGPRGKQTNEQTEVRRFAQAHLAGKVVELELKNGSSNSKCQAFPLDSVVQSIHSLSRNISFLIKTSALNHLLFLLSRHLRYSYYSYR